MCQQHRSSRLPFARGAEKGPGTAPTCEKRAVLENQPIAWNPSITGTKSEDTIVALAGRTEIVSETPDWPMIDVEIDGRVIRRPDILVLD